MESANGPANGVRAFSNTQGGYAQPLPSYFDENARTLFGASLTLVCEPRDCLLTAKQWQVIAWGKQCSSQRAFRSPRTVKRNRRFPAAIWRPRRQIAAGKVGRMRFVFLGFHPPR